MMRKIASCPAICQLVQHRKKQPVRLDESNEMGALILNTTKTELQASVIHELSTSVFPDSDISSFISYSIGYSTVDSFVTAAFVKLIQRVLVSLIVHEFVSFLLCKLHV